MPSKKTQAGRRYEIDGKKFTWHPIDENDEMGNLPDVVLPLWFKFGKIRPFLSEGLDMEAQTGIIEAIAPGQAASVDEMDPNDIGAMFTAWQTEYQRLTGVTLGESQP